MRCFKLHILPEPTQAMSDLFNKPILFNLSLVIPIGSHGDGMLMMM